MADNDKRALIRSMLDEALARYGTSIELAAIENSWGDTLTDAEVYAWLKTFLARGTGIEHVGAEVDDFDALDQAFQQHITKH